MNEVQNLFAKRLHDLRRAKGWSQPKVGKLIGTSGAIIGCYERAVVQAVKRNAGRFPVDFMFQLDAQEWESLRSQTVISNAAGVGAGRGGRRTAPYAFTEQGVAMLSSVLSSERAEPTLEVIRNMARALVFEQDERKPGEELGLQFEAVSQLPPDEQAIVREVLKSLIIKYPTRRWDVSRATAKAAVTTKATAPGKTPPKRTAQAAR